MDRTGLVDAISFRVLGRHDMATLHRWLNDPAVVEWWEGEDVSWKAVQGAYGPGDTDPVEHWLALLDGEPLGWIQCYLAADFADEDETKQWIPHLDISTTGGIDYLIGTGDHRGRGVGSAMIRAFVDQIVFPRHRAWRRVAASPFEANVASWRALEKAGFRRQAVFDDEQGPCVLMVLDRMTEHPD